MLSLWKKFLSLTTRSGNVRRNRKRASSADVQHLEQRQLLTTLALDASADVTLDGLHNQEANLGARPQLELLTDQYRPLIEFDLSSVSLLPEEIASARLELYQLSTGILNQDMDLSLHAVSRDWEEGGGFANNVPGSGASWLNATSAEMWSTPGGDFNASFDFGNGPNGVIDTETLTATTIENYHDFDVTTAVQAWLAGDLPNFGFAIQAHGTQFTEYQIASSENSNAAIRPRLIIETQEASLPIVEVGSTGVLVSESDSTATVTVMRRGDTTVAQTVDYTTVAGSATPGLDYTTTSGTLLFAAGATSATINIPLLDDAADEANETFGLQLSNPSEGALLLDVALIAISDDDVPATTTHTATVTKDNQLDSLHNQESNLGGRVRMQLQATYVDLIHFDLPAINADPNDILSADIELQRFNTFNGGSMDVDVRVLDRDWEEGTGFANNVPGNGSSWLNAATGSQWATPGGDFNSTFDFGLGANGIVSQNAVPTIVGTADTVAFDATGAVKAFYNGDLVNFGFGLQVTSTNFNENEFHSSEATDPAVRPALVIEVAAPQVLSVVSAVAVTEGSTLLMTIDRAGTTQGSVTVDYTTISGSAIAGSDFTAQSGTFVFADGEARRTISVPVALDGTADSGETFTLQLSNPSSRAVLGNATASVTIEENAGSFGFDVAAMAINETAGTATFTVNRTGGLNGATSVNYSTQDVTTTVGSDYSSTSGTLTFAQGEVSKTVTISITDDTTFETAELFTLNLSNPTNGATLGNATVTGLIVSDDAFTPPENTPPTAVNDSFTTSEEDSITLNVLANDLDTESNIVPGFTVDLSLPAAGTLTNNEDGTFEFNPDQQFESLAAGESASVSFDYQIRDSFGETSQGTAEVIISGVNDEPFINVGSSEVTADVGDEVTNSGAFSDVDLSDDVTITASLGTITQDAGNTGLWNWSFTPDANTAASQVVVITATDGHGGVENTSFVLNVSASVIDIEFSLRTGYAHNVINLNELFYGRWYEPTVQVVVKTTDEFDATSVDVGTVEFAGAQVDRSRLRDVDGDGDLDLVLRFNVRDTNLLQSFTEIVTSNPPRHWWDYFYRLESVELELTGSTHSGSDFSGTETANLFMSGGALWHILNT